MHTHIQKCTHIHINAHTHTEMYAHIHTNAHTHTHTNVHTHACTHTHTYTQMHKQIHVLFHSLSYITLMQQTAPKTSWAHLVIAVYFSILGIHSFITRVSWWPVCQERWIMWRGSTGLGLGRGTCNQRTDSRCISGPTGLRQYFRRRREDEKTVNSEEIVTAERETQWSLCSVCDLTTQNN